VLLASGKLEVEHDEDAHGRTRPACRRPGGRRPGAGWVHGPLDPHRRKERIMNLGEWLLSFFLVFLWIAWIWLVISILIDIFRSDDLSGWGKAGWTLLVVFLTWIGVLIYLIARGKDMNERRFAEAAKAQSAREQYIRQVAADSGAASATSPADEVAKLADLHKQGVLTDEEFRAQKAKVLG
jgi:hypothetical protein